MFPEKMNAAQPAITAEAVASSLAEYRCLPIRNPQSMTGNILQHLASVCMAKVMYFKLSYWQVEATKLPNDTAAYDIIGATGSTERRWIT